MLLFKLHFFSFTCQLNLTCMAIDIADLANQQCDEIHRVIFSKHKIFPKLKMAMEAGPVIDNCEVIVSNIATNW